MTAPLSPDEGVRAALVQVLTYLEGQHAKTKSNGVVNADVRRTIAALSTPVPEEGIPRGTASGAEGEPVAWFYEFLGHNDQWIADVRLAKPKAPSGGAIRNVRPLSFASALPSPLPSQGEPAAWIVEESLFGQWRERIVTEKPEEGPRIRILGSLYTAEALAAERVRADSLKAERDEFERLSEYWKRMDHIHLQSANAEKARADRAEEALRNALIWHEAADKAISKQPNANQGQNGWMRCQHQEQMAEIRNILKDTPHDER